ncbi:similar to ankyrin 2,3/unc44 [Ectocarpus siliculosus]|uniref:Similar to ankyrin 2,3/unc44 n=1 Tax=Ectocarpus siliculosus TaxID=2880 RepID=D7FVH7_ECTSI|nr:similar to ankyrin 2,3/unc44 [Ectocarpus siliculosus]|eukprot:CBJ31898.1 similar to ankyrin 2,3/unc44 [Ectocarpus siliculosus]
MIECLLNNGADVNAASPLMLHQGEDGRMSLCQGVRAIHVAVIHHDRKCLKVLIDAGANLDVTYSGGVTPLMAACKMRVEEHGIEMVKEVIEAGANPLIQDNKRWACLWYAINLGRIRTIQTILSVAPTTVNQVAPDGSTPLYMASGFGQYEAVSLLLSAGAKQTRLSFEKGKCPLDVAVRQNRTDVVRVLLSDGLHAIGGSLVLPQATSYLRRREESDGGEKNGSHAAGRGGRRKAAVLGEELIPAHPFAWLGRGM